MPITRRHALVTAAIAISQAARNSINRRARQQGGAGVCPAEVPSSGRRGQEHLVGRLAQYDLAEGGR
jgi:hypothetical protein